MQWWQINRTGYASVGSYGYAGLGGVVGYDYILYTKLYKSHLFIGFRLFQVDMVVCD